MSADGSLTLQWADGEHRFRLPIGQLRELQDKCDAGPAELLARLSQHRWRVDDLREVIRLGLIGGGMQPVQALTMVKRYVENRPLLESVPVATSILLSALVGASDDPVGENEAGTTETETAPADSSSPRSTAAALQ